MTEQAQRAGNNANQIQVHGDLITVIGVTEQRAAEIAEQRMLQVLAEYSEEAREEAQRRIDEFDARLISRLGDNGLLDRLADPAVQVQLKRAQLTAASTERESDYDVLTNLLGERVESGSRILRAALARAVDVVDSVDAAALSALTALWVLQTFGPVAGQPLEGIDALEELYGEFDLDALPAGGAWIEHLDVLDLIRPARHGIATFKRFDDFVMDMIPGYFTAGFDAVLEAEIVAAGIRDGLPNLDIVDHQLRDKAVPPLRRINFPSAAQLANAIKQAGHSVAVSDQLLELAKRVDFQTVSPDVKARFNAEVDKRPNTARLRDWWNQIPLAVTITSSGVALAHANWTRQSSTARPSPLGHYLGAGGAP